MVTASMSLPRQHQIATAIHAPAPAGRNESRGVELLDDGRPDDRRADVEALALVEARTLSRIGEHKLARPLVGCRNSSQRRPHLALLGLLDGLAEPHPVANHIR